MGFNFRKRIKLGKLFNLNIGKSGLSLSFGKKGIRQSISTKGRGRTTLSIPGTGLYYTKSYSAKPLIKKLGQKDLFKPAGDTQSPVDEVQEFNEDLQILMNLHQEIDYENNLDWQRILEEEPPFEKGKMGPHEILAIDEIKKDQKGLFNKILNFGKKNHFNERIQAEAKEKDLLLYKAYENLQILARKINVGKKEEFLDVLKELKISDLLSGYVDAMEFSYTDEDSLKVDMVVSVDDFIPKSYKTLTPTGKLSLKTYTKTDYYEVSSQFISGIILKTVRNLFQLLPIADVFINFIASENDELSQRKEEKLIYSGYFSREQVENMSDFDKNPFDLIISFPHEVKFVKTRGFKPIEPLDELFHR